MKGCFLFIAAALLVACTEGGEPARSVPQAAAGYLDYSGRDDVLSGGVKMVPVATPAGDFRVWTKRVGNNPRVRVLLLHGGPGMTHEYLEAFDSYFPAAGIEYYYYDQLGSFYSDQPDAPELWNIPRFVEEVEQVRLALGLDADNFFLFGHSWGGALVLEYALKYQQHLKGLIVSNMMASGPAYQKYAEDVLMPEMDPAVLAEVKAIEAAGDSENHRYMELLMPPMDQDVLAEIKRLEATGDTENPRYMELLVPHHYEQHILRMPAASWPDPVNRGIAHVNPAVYVPMQGPSELGISGVLGSWDRSGDLGRIAVPTLMIGARYDTMDPAYMSWMAEQVQNGTYLYSDTGSHLAMYDDQQVYFDGLIEFIRSVSGAPAGG
ncbi:MAG TPA: proline iminopeptidase-family hydrolase [Pseudomonadales bacterium]